MKSGLSTAVVLPYDEHMKKLVLIAIAAMGGIMVFKLLNSEYQPPPNP